MKYSHGERTQFLSIQDVFENRDESNLNTSHIVIKKPIAKDDDENGREAKFIPKSFYLFGRDNFLRKFCIKLILWKPFDIFIICLIIINSIMLGAMDYTDTENKSWRNQIVDKSEPIFIVLFTLECLIKVK